LKKSEHSICAGGDHDAAQTAKILETAVFPAEMGNQLFQTFGSNASFQYDLASLCAVHHSPGPWSGAGTRI